ncbi:hypothetical protein ccbrp13_09750 [Ktedonobacteria bacterium brp13]|nr:hypothetical protein ccbrp13_09750 [Ktedonobacteria bacterium brp13]
MTIYVYSYRDSSVRMRSDALPERVRILDFSADYGTSKAINIDVSIYGEQGQGIKVTCRIVLANRRKNHNLKKKGI